MLKGYLCLSTTNYENFNCNTSQGEWDPDLKFHLMPSFSNFAKIACDFASEAYWLECKKRFVKKMLSVEEMAEKKMWICSGQKKKMTRDEVLSNA